MTDEEKKRDAESIRAIFEGAIGEALNRISDISDEERADNRAFDRAARTALSFMRVAESAAGIFAQKRKDERENEKPDSGADEARIARDEAVLKQRLAEHLDRLRGHRADGADRHNVSPNSESEGNGA